MTWSRSREEEAQLAGKKFRPAIEPPYRWRDWAAKQDGITGDELIASSTTTKRCGPTASEAPGSSPICAACKAPTATTGAT